MIHRLTISDLQTFREMLAVFAEAFEDPENYSAAPPSDAYVLSRIADPNFVALVSKDGGRTVGALAAYVLRKFEQERAEVYIYDLAVASSHRRKGVATSLIQNLQKIASEIGAEVIFVQADHGDDPAIALYESLGVGADVMHFDIKVP
ncbi:MAG: AAC(3)-I family aminoglycoside N-acetyltransferase [Pseudomonadota bacterium]